MTLVTLQDLENSLKINQLLKLQQQQHQVSNNLYSDHQQSNLNFMLQNASVTKANLLTSVMMQQLQLQQQQNNNINNNSNSNSSKSQVFIHSNKTTSSSSKSNESGQQQKGQINSGRYKTELCRQFVENGGCKYGDKCQFAHGSPDLKDINRHPKYKTDYCRTFHSKGFCPYGPRCHFIHELNEKFEGNTGGAVNKKQMKSTEGNNSQVNSNELTTQLEAIQSRLSNNLFLTDENFNAAERLSAYNLSLVKNLNQMDELNSSFMSSSLSPPLSPMPQPRTRSGTSSTSSLISSSSSFDLSQSDRVFSPMPRPQQASNLIRQSSVFNLPISKNLIQIGQSLIQEKLSNPSQDQATLNQQILNIERLNNILNSNQLNFYHTGSQQQSNTW